MAKIKFSSKCLFAILLTISFVLFSFFNFRMPTMPNIIGMKLVDASKKIENLDFVTSIGILKDIPISNCRKNIDISFINYKKSYWKADVELNQSCIIIGIDWKWRGFDL